MREIANGNFPLGREKIKKKKQRSENKRHFNEPCDTKQQREIFNKEKNKSKSHRWAAGSGKFQPRCLLQGTGLNLDTFLTFPPVLLPSPHAHLRQSTEKEKKEKLVFLTPIIPHDVLMWNSNTNHITKLQQ